MSVSLSPGDQASLSPPIVSTTKPAGIWLCHSPGKSINRPSKEPRPRPRSSAFVRARRASQSESVVGGAWGAGQPGGRSQGDERIRSPSRVLTGRPPRRASRVGARVPAPAVSVSASEGRPPWAARPPTTRRIARGTRQSHRSRARGRASPLRAGRAPRADRRRRASPHVGWWSFGAGWRTVAFRSPVGWDAAWSASISAPSRAAEKPTESGNVLAGRTRSVFCLDPPAKSSGRVLRFGRGGGSRIRREPRARLLQRGWVYGEEGRNLSAVLVARRRDRGLGVRRSPAIGVLDRGADRGEDLDEGRRRARRDEWLHTVDRAPALRCRERERLRLVEAGHMRDPNPADLHSAEDHLGAAVEGQRSPEPGA